MNTVSEQKDKLFKRYPLDDLRISDIQKAQKQKYENLMNTISMIASAVTLNDDRVFNDAATEYRLIYDNFVDTGYCISECLREKLQNEKDKTRFRVKLIQTDLNNLDHTKRTLEKTLERTISTITERTEELKDWEEKLTQLELEVE